MKPNNKKILPMKPKPKTPPNAEAGCLLEATTTAEATMTNTTTKPNPETDNSGLNKIRAELDKPTTPPTAGQDTTPKPKPKKESDASIRIMVDAALTTPFTIVRGITGSERFQILPEIKADLINIGVQVYKDFGPEAYAKWINLAIFTLLYGSTWYTAFSGYFAEQKAKKAAEKKEQEKPPSATLRDLGDVQEDARKKFQEQMLEREKANAAGKKSSV
jgi:hypothetical protein